MVKSHGREHRRKRPGTYRVRCHARRRMKMNPPMTCRKLLEDVKTAVCLLTAGQSLGATCLRTKRHPAYRGLDLAEEADMRNVGTFRPDANGEAQVEIPRGESTEAGRRGGTTRSSDEVLETGWSEGVVARSQSHRSTRNGRRRCLRQNQTHLQLSQWVGSLTGAV